ncbi:MAG: glycosyltransferase family 4 protein [Chitinispirillia bacterium]|nr:glycosyltransferase family 4 protein [Chitinispirillia bacterium]MCL2267598.1 glycosyltransferase family 4 protein [Chitinispirillia bacterium]
MNILALNWRDMEHPEAGGAEVHFTETFSRLVDKGHNVTLLTTRFKGCRPDTICRGIEVLRHGSNFTFNWEAPFIIKKALKAKKYDCIIDDVNKLPFYSNVWFKSIPCAVFYHHLFGKTVFGLTNPPMALYVYLMERVSPRIYSKTACCAVSTSTAEELVRHGMDKSGLTVIENGIDINRYCLDKSIQRDDDLLVFVGRLKKYKRVDAILEAMSIIENNSGRKLKLSVIGTGDDLLRLKKRAGGLGLEGRVDFVGFVDEDKKIELLRKAAIFVNPSEKEGWGITNIEAAACGVPVVANDAPGLRDSVVDSETGFLYANNDVQALASSIQKLLDDGRLKERLGINGRAWAEKFSWDASAKRIEEWLLKIVSEK